MNRFIHLLLKGKIMQGATYFATDGSYGDATDLIVIDTDLFTEEDWDEIQNASDADRADLAYEILMSK